RLLRELAAGRRAAGVAGLDRRLRPGALARAGAGFLGLGLAASLPLLRGADRSGPADPPAHPGDAALPATPGGQTGRADASDRIAATALANGPAGRRRAPHRELLLLPVQRLRPGLQQSGTPRP